MLHREQSHNFKHRILPISEPKSLLKPTYLGIRVGDLYEHLISVIWSTVGTLEGASTNFTLINVFSPLNLVSYGTSRPPPNGAFAKGSRIVFTFSLSFLDDYPQDLSGRLRLSNYDYMWHGSSGHRFLIIGIPLDVGAKLGLFDLMPNTLRYLFNVVGWMTKTFVIRHSYYSPSEDYGSVVGLESLLREKDCVLAAPIGDCIKHLDYPEWAFNREIWDYAPNLLSYRCVSPTLSLYLLAYLNPWPRSVPALRLLGLKQDDSGLPTLGSTVLDYLTQSLTLFVQSVNTDTKKSFYSELELLAPVAIESLLFKGNLKLDLDVGSREGVGFDSDQDLRWVLSQSYNRLMDIVKTRGVDLGSLLLPARPVALKMMVGDLEFCGKLLSTLSIEDDL